MTVALPTSTVLEVGDAVTVTGPGNGTFGSQRLERGTVVNAVDLTAVLASPAVPLAEVDFINTLDTCRHGTPRAEWCEACVNEGWGE